jgi:hypothetical protein
MSRQPQEPLHSFSFPDPDVRPVEGPYSHLQQAIMPVVGMAGGQVEAFASAFCISVSMSIVVTAWHVIDNFVTNNRIGLANGSCHLAVVFETSEKLPAGHYLGGPLPVESVRHLEGTDLAVLRLFDVLSGDDLIVPARMAAIGFESPPPQDYCYGFGYPRLAGGPITRENGRPVVEFVRQLHVTGGRVWDVFPLGQNAAGRLSRWCPYFDCDAPTPGGMSGGPVMTDKAGLCGSVSTSYDPYEDGDRWASNVSLLAPLLACPVLCADGSGRTVEATIHELATDGHIDVHGRLPSPPKARAVETLRFPVPDTLGTWPA